MLDTTCSISLYTYLLPTSSPITRLRTKVVVAATEVVEVDIASAASVPLAAPSIEEEDEDVVVCVPTELEEREAEEDSAEDEVCERVAVDVMVDPLV